MPTAEAVLQASLVHTEKKKEGGAVPLETSLQRSTGWPSLELDPAGVLLSLARERPARWQRQTSPISRWYTGLSPEQVVMEDEDDSLYGQ